VPRDQKGAASSTAAGSGGGAFGQPLQGHILTLAGGFITAASYAYLSKPVTYPADMFQNGKPPDLNQGYEAAPASASSAQGIVGRYLA